MEQIVIHTDDIQLDQALKLASVVQSGGEVKGMIASQMIFLNGKLVSERRKKVRPGDLIEVQGKGSMIIVKQ